MPALNRRGSESPLSLLVYAWLPRATMRMDPIIQTALSPPKRDMLPTGTTWVVPQVWQKKPG